MFGAGGLFAVHSPSAPPPWSPRWPACSARAWRSELSRC
jgi:hypothetical protein